MDLVESLLLHVTCGFMIKTEHPYSWFPYIQIQLHSNYSGLVQAVTDSGSFWGAAIEPPTKKQLVCGAASLPFVILFSRCVLIGRGWNNVLLVGVLFKKYQGERFFWTLKKKCQIVADTLFE